MLLVGQKKYKLNALQKTYYNKEAVFFKSLLSFFAGFAGNGSKCLIGFGCIFLLFLSHGQIYSNRCFRWAMHFFSNLRHLLGIEFFSYNNNTSIHSIKLSCLRDVDICFNVFLSLFSRWVRLINKNGSYFYIFIPLNGLRSLCNFFKYNSLFLFNVLYDIIVVDHPSRKKRFELNYCFVSVFRNLRVFFKLNCTERDNVETILFLYSSANWLEREAWDLFGIFFKNHTNLRRILTDYGFKGYPFRKDFPLTGYVESRFDDSKNSIVYEPVELTQEFRFFNFRSPWESIVPLV